MNRTSIAEQLIREKEEILRKAKPDTSNLQECIEDSRRAALDNDLGPQDPTVYSQLRGRLEASKEKLPPLYRQSVFKPYTTALNDIGETGFFYILLRDPAREGMAGLMLDIAHSILQNGEKYNEMATDAFQEVVSDLYDGFLSAEDRRGVKPPDKGVIPPLVKWGRPEFGPYTWPVEATSSFGVEAAIVNLPPANARQGILAWAALGHETAGHDILSADTGLREELIKAVQSALERNLKKENAKNELPEYWSTRIDETASDVLGILNMGPAAGIGLIGYFRGLNAAYTGISKLRNEGSESDPHPADILRGYLAASTVNLLRFNAASEWAKVIEAETDKDLTTVRIGDTKISAEEAKRSAEIVAATIVKTKMESLENHALGEIQNWRNRDELIVNKLISILNTANDLPQTLASGIYAAHVVAAAIISALSKDSDIPLLFNRMLALLKKMHDANPSWGPLFVKHPGDAVPHMTYYKTAE